MKDKLVWFHVNPPPLFLKGRNPPFLSIMGALSKS